MSAKGETKTSAKKQETTRNDEKSTSTPEFRTEMEYFQRERSRLDTSMKRQLSKHVKPEKKEYFPYVFNSLEPYADMNVYSKALDAPFKTPQYQYRSRNTAHGLKDPTISHSMDTNLNYFDDKGKRNRERRKVLQEMQQKLQQDDVARSSTASTDSWRDQSTSEKTDVTGKDEREPASGKPAGQQQKRPQSNSTATGGETRRTTTRRSRSNEKTSEKSDETERFPLFPTVIAVPNELSGKDLNYSHVPRLREELHNTYSMNASRKIDQQYRLTKHEFHQRQLDRVNEYHPDSWPTMREAYFAYLQNNPGSARAVRECVKRLDDDVEQEQQQQQTARNERQEPAESNNKEQEETEDDGGAASQKRMEIIQGAQYKLNLIGGHYD